MLTKTERMKNGLKWIFRGGLIYLLLIVWGCEDISNPDAVQIESVKKEVASGGWIISRFEDSGKDETGDFAGFVFEFLASGSVTATKGGTIYTGNWSITNSSGNSNRQVNDSSPDDLDFNIFFNLTNEFEDLNDDWDIVSYSSSKIELIDVSGGNGGIDYLTFVKN
jgi:hypothetical protein